MFQNAMGRTLLFIFGNLLAASGCQRVPPAPADADQDETSIEVRRASLDLEPIDQPRPPQPVPDRLIQPTLWKSTHVAGPPGVTAQVEVAGRVLGDNGTPAAGTRVFLVSAHRQIATAKTGADGRFSFGPQTMPAIPRDVPGVRPLVLYRVFASAETRALVASGELGFVDGPRPDWDKTAGAIYQNEPIDVPLQHPAASALRGRVVNPDGSPIAGASVRLIAVVPRKGSSFSNEGWDDSNLLATTDADGHFQFGNIPVESRVTVEVVATGFACVHATALTFTPTKGDHQHDESELWHPGHGGNWTIGLADPKPQRVQVVDGGTGLPLAGFDVSAALTSRRLVAGTNELREVTRHHPVSPRAWAKTDANGYAILWLPTGDYDVGASPGSVPGYHGDSMSLWHVDASTVGRTQQLTASPYVVTIEIVEAGTGKPVRNGHVQLLMTYAATNGGPNRAGFPRTYFWGPTGWDGRFQGRNPFHNPFEPYTSRQLRDALAKCEFKVAGLEEWEVVEMPKADLDLLVSTKPIFKFTVRRLPKK